MHSPDIDLLDILLLLCSGHAFVGPVTRGWTISLTLALSFSWKEISSKGTVIFHKALGPQQIIIFKNKLISWSFSQLIEFLYDVKLGYGTF